MTDSGSTWRDWRYPSRARGTVPGVFGQRSAGRRYTRSETARTSHLNIVQRFSLRIPKKVLYAGILIPIMMLGVAAAVVIVSDSQAQHYKWTTKPTYDVYLATTGTQTFQSPEKIAASLLALNQNPSGPTVHFLYMLINITNYGWLPDRSAFQWSNTTINGTPVSPQFVSQTSQGYEWAMGTFTLPYNQQVTFNVDVTFQAPDPILHTGRPYGNYDLALWTASVS